MKNEKVFLIPEAIIVTFTDEEIITGSGFWGDDYGEDPTDENQD